MNVAIIGTGNVGRALAASFTRAGHTVTLASRDPEHAAAAAAATGARTTARGPALPQRAGEIQYPPLVRVRFLRALRRDVPLRRPSPAGGIQAPDAAV